MKKALFHFIRAIVLNFSRRHEFNSSNNLKIEKRKEEKCQQKIHLLIKYILYFTLISDYAFSKIRFLTLIISFIINSKRCFFLN